MGAERNRGRITPRTLGEWGAVVPQWLGIVGLVVQLALWVVERVVTGMDVVSPALLTAFGGLIVVGQGAGAINALRDPPEAVVSPKRQGTADEPETYEKA